MAGENLKTHCPSIELLGGNKIPQVGFGTYELKGQACINSVRNAIHSGYRHIDTAGSYKNGKDIATALEDLYEQNIVKREDLYITSKISAYDHGYEKALKACDEILEHLKTPYLDLLLIHWPGVKTMKSNSKGVADKRLETWKALEKLKTDGKVKDIGVSNFLVRHLEHLAANSKVIPVVNQIELHPFCYNEEVVEYCKKKGIAIEAYSPLARNKEILWKNKIIFDIAMKYNKTVQHIALKWSLQKDFIVLPKSKHAEYIKSNFELFDFELEDSDMKELAKLNKNYHTCWNPEEVKY